MPDLTPAHHVVLQTGMMGSMGGFAFRLPMIWGNLKNTIFIIFSKFWDLSKICARRVPELPETLSTGRFNSGRLANSELRLNGLS